MLHHLFLQMMYLILYHKHVVDAFDNILSDVIFLLVLFVLRCHVLFSPILILIHHFQVLKLFQHLFLRIFVNFEVFFEYLLKFHIH